jgi:beta-glucosidase
VLFRSIAYYSEELLIGYRWFDTKNVKPMFPFGHGLSYTTFQYANIKTDKTKYAPDETIQVSLNVTNTGKADADEVVQVYVHRIKSKVFWPYKELKAFERISLKAGETKNLKLEVPVKNLRYWDEAKYDWILEHGTIEILVGASSGDIRLNTQAGI